VGFGVGVFFGFWWFFWLDCWFGGGWVRFFLVFGFVVGFLGFGLWDVLCFFFFVVGVDVGGSLPSGRRLLCRNRVERANQGEDP